MKRTSTILLAMLAVTMILTLVSCGKKDSLVGVWEYNDVEAGIYAAYDLKDDGTGTYTLKADDDRVVYELKYEVKNGHLLARYVNNELYSEEDVFDNEFSRKNDNTLIIKDPFSEEMTFVKK